MHKLKKGIKKKLKGKKDPKSDDLFDPEQLAKYKREKELAQQALAQQQEDEEDNNLEHCHNKASSSGSANAAASETNEEWERFKLLTAGVDDILKKTSGDLDRIKTESYYQRKSPQQQVPSTSSQHQQHSSTPTDNQGWINVHEAHEESELSPDSNLKKSSQQDDHKEADEPDSETVEQHTVKEEEPIQLGDELFDTSFVDAVELGEIKLAYIPESPTEEQGDDPFDTSGVVEVVKKIEEAERKEKRKINLGLAVNVLTNVNTDQNSTEGIKKAPLATKRRVLPHKINLLGSPDENDSTSKNFIEQSSSSQITKAEKDVFDEVVKDVEDPGLLESQPLELCPTVAKFIPKTPEATSNENTVNFKDFISEFETFDETVETETFKNEQLIGQEKQISFDEFDELAISSIRAEGKLSQLNVEEVTKIEEENACVEDDPFDTSYAVKAIHENDILQCSVQDEENVLLSDKNPAATEKLPDPQVDLPKDTDPFDTSAVAVGNPGPAELKQLEQELLTENDTLSSTIIPSHVIIQAKIGKSFSLESDFDFDPREGEEFIVKVAVDSIEITPHPLDSEEVNESEGHVVLVPTTENEPDPFDTSTIPTSVHLPGKAELRQLEEELVAQQDQEEYFASNDLASHNELGSDDLLGAHHHESVGHEPLCPVQFNSQDIPIINQQVKESECFEDPFDTSAVDVREILTGKVEIRQLEDELLSSKLDVIAPKPKITAISLDKISKKPEQILFHPLDHSVEAEEAHDKTPIKPLSPINPLFASLSDYRFEDPFDTSVANFVGPGKTEIKLLEEELQGLPNTSCHSQPSTFVNPEFNLSYPDQSQTFNKSNTSDFGETAQFAVEIDPFDTSSINLDN